MLQSLFKKAPNMASNAWTQQSDSVSLLAFSPYHCHFAAFKRLKPCLGRFLINFATFVRGLFGPASTKEASNKPAENHDRQLKFNSDTIEHF